MHFIKIDYPKALSLQEEGKITLVDVSRGQLPPLKEEHGQLWKDNFERLLIKVPHISPEKILDFFSLIKRQSAVHLVRDPVMGERLFENP